MSESAVPVEVELAEEEQQQQQQQQQQQPPQQQETGADKQELVVDQREETEVVVDSAKNYEEVREAEPEVGADQQVEQAAGDQKAEEESDQQQQTNDLGQESRQSFEQEQQQEQQVQQTGEKDTDSRDKEQPLELSQTSQNSVLLPVENLSQERAIEDEEMPSMVTIDMSSRIDESDLRQEEKYSPQPVPKKLEARYSPQHMPKKVEEKYSPQPMPKKVEDSDSDSVCVIDDDDDEEQQAVEEDEDEEEEYSYDDDEDGGSSSYDEEAEEIERRRRKAEYDKRMASKTVRKVENVEDEEDEDEDEDEDEEMEEEEEVEEFYREEGSEEDSGPDCFDGASDDLVVRHSNGLNKQVKERSTSLQDLSFSKAQAVKGRTSINPLSQKAIFERNQLERKGTPGKYDHVESKVKKYIMDMSEQRRMSTERRKKAQEEEARFRNQDVAASQMYRNEEIVTTCKTMKNYTEKTLKEVAEENKQFFVPPQGFDNGEITIFHKQSADNRQSMIDQELMEVDPIALDQPRNDERVDKINGTAVNDNQNNFVDERKGIRRRDEYSPKTVLNGEDPNYVSNLRTLSYDEYMKGPSQNEIVEEVISDERTISQVQNVLGNCNNNEVDEQPCILEIDSVKSNYQMVDGRVDDEEDFENRKTPVMFTQPTKNFYQEPPEISELKKQLQQRAEQFENLKDIYQKILSDNMAMKTELGNLRAIVAYYQEKDTQIPEKKAVAIQTVTVEKLARSMPLIDIDGDEEAGVPVDPRAAANSMISAASTQWSDSTGSAAFSIDPPPSVTTALFSDESTATQGKKHKSAFSRAFVTSSRILQTLSNITTGKTKSDKYGKKGSSPKHPEIVIDSVEQTNKQDDQQSGPSNSRKRKASDNMDEMAQPFKIPHTTNTDRQKPTDPTTSQATEGGQVANPSDNDGSTSDGKAEFMNQMQGLLNDDDVKVFLYPEDESGKEHSFLIQAKEVGSNPNRGVRECGPYLLGNVEVYMTEMNGTINIWGKELSQGSVSQNLDDLDTSARSKDLKTNLRWQSTPRIFNKHSSSSTSKKSRVVPRFNQHPCEPVASCSSHHHRNSCSSLHQSCCARRVEETCCGCRHTDRCNIDYVPSCKSHLMDAGRYSLPNVHQEASCCGSGRHSHHRSTAVCEDSARHRSFVRRHSFSPTDDEDEVEQEDQTLEEGLLQQHSKVGAHKSNSPNSRSPSKEKLVSPGPTRQSNSSETLATCENESDPLISQRLHLEEPESRKRRRSGKRVRGLLLDLLKGNCGDCKASDSVINSNLQQNASMYEPSSFVQKTIACSPSKPSCSLRSNEKCSSCRVTGDKTTELEAKLEFFRTEMEKLNSCSSNLREMLESLRNEATAKK